MQKIVIVSSQPDKDNPLLVAMLNVLFPECEIQVTSGEPEPVLDRMDNGVLPYPEGKKTTDFSVGGF